MAFGINDTGIERGATQLLFPDPPILMDRHAEDAPDAAFEVAIPGNPVVVVYNRDQQRTFLHLRLRLLDAADITTLQALWAGSDPVTVKLTPGDATTILCMFGPRADQKLLPYNDDYATGQPDGSPVDPLLQQYHAELLLLRLG